VSVTTGRSGGRRPAWLNTAFEPGIVKRADRLGWGFRNETWRVVLADGRRVAVTRLADTEATPSIVGLMTSIQPRLLSAGIPSPVLVDLAVESTRLIVTELIDGTPGAELLGQEGGPHVVGSVLGAAWRRLAAVDLTGLDLPATWATPHRLVSDSFARLTRARSWLNATDRRLLFADLEALGSQLSNRRPSFVHGDLIPVNILIRRGQLSALLDFEFVRLADPLLDAAWFDWIVAYHHPADEPAAWRAFVTAADLDDHEPVTRELLRVLPLVRLLEILDDDRLRDDHAGEWIEMLRACLTRPR
jgi:Ser/Thr protein kinase RdoA (MazF antagonist)